jgi:hypothetical protein
LAETGYLIIDDIAAALAKASPVGQSILGQPAGVLRDAVCSLAARRGWLVVTHEAYSTWARNLIAKDQGNWVVLDPLFSANGAGGRVRALRFSRIFGHGGQGLEGPPIRLQLDGDSTRVAVLDDAIASGRTLRLADQIIRQEGGVTSRLATCAAAPLALQSLRRALPSAVFDTFVPGEWWTAHLRDGCPHLPFSGRPSGLEVDSVVGAGRIELRVLSRHVVGNPWQGFYLDSSIRAAAAAVARAVASELARMLGRPACIADLGLLGSNVPGVIGPGGSVTSDTRLDTLLAAG